MTDVKKVIAEFIKNPIAEVMKFVKTVIVNLKQITEQPFAIILLHLIVKDSIHVMKALNTEHRPKKNGNLL